MLSPLERIVAFPANSKPKKHSCSRSKYKFEGHKSEITDFVTKRINFGKMFASVESHLVTLK